MRRQHHWRRNWKKKTISYLTFWILKSSSFRMIPVQLSFSWEKNHMWRECRSCTWEVSYCPLKIMFSFFYESKGWHIKFINWFPDFSCQLKCMVKAVAINSKIKQEVISIPWNMLFHVPHFPKGTVGLRKNELAFYRLNVCGLTKTKPEWLEFLGER